MAGSRVVGLLNGDEGFPCAPRSKPGALVDVGVPWHADSAEVG